MSNLILVSNNHYSDHPIFGSIYELSFRREDGSDLITWSELQQAKNEIYGEDSQALEVYPASKDVVNESNVRHLWIISKDYKIPFTTK